MINLVNYLKDAYNSSSKAIFSQVFSKNVYVRLDSALKILYAGKTDLRRICTSDSVIIVC